MPFNSALSGLQTSNAQLRILSDSIANASTLGFRRSRAEFRDVFGFPSLLSSTTASELARPKSNQQKLDELGINNEDFPEEFLCAILMVVMDDPVRLKKQHQVIDKSVLVRINGKNPFTNLPMEDGNVEECQELKARIDKFVTDKEIAPKISPRV